MTDEELIAEVKKRCIVFELIDVTDDALVDELVRRVGEGELHTSVVFKALNDFDLSDDEDEAAIRRLMENAGIEHEEHEEILCIAGQLAFAPLTNWAELIRDLNLEFRKHGATCMQTAKLF